MCSIVYYIKYVAQEWGQHGRHQDPAYGAPAMFQTHFTTSEYYECRWVIADLVIAEHKIAHKIAHKIKIPFSAWIVSERLIQSTP